MPRGRRRTGEAPITTEPAEPAGHNRPGSSGQPAGDGPDPGRARSGDAEPDLSGSTDSDAAPEAGQAPPPDLSDADLDELRERVQDIEDVPLGRRPALFEELDRRLSEELDAVSDEAPAETDGHTGPVDGGSAEQPSLDEG